MNLSKLMMDALTDPRKRGIAIGVKMGFAGWMYCWHHCGSIWDWQCFKNGCSIGWNAFRGRG